MEECWNSHGYRSLDYQWVSPGEEHMRRHRAGEQMFHWFSRRWVVVHTACASVGYRTVDHLIRGPSPSVWSRLTCLLCQTLQWYKLWWVLSPGQDKTHTRTQVFFFFYLQYFIKSNEQTTKHPAKSTTANNLGLEQILVNSAVLQSQPPCGNATWKSFYFCTI